MFHIRAAHPSDAAALTVLLRGIGWFAHFTEGSEAEAQARLSRNLALCQADNSHSVYVVESLGGQVIGYAIVHWLPYFILPAPEGYISDLFVEASARNQGVGTGLLEAIKEEALKRGCARLSLLNNRKRESYQRGFYNRVGWEARPEMVNFIFRLETTS